ncbi:MAG: 4-hydroxy-3-methylbut-2-enyl diphosphate reductase [Bacteroidota bacterium]
MEVVIDPHAGFCFGVVYAISIAEEELSKGNGLYCLGEIVHNNREVERLAAKGLKVINHDTYRTLKDCKVLIRAHGEPPETYKLAVENNIELIDASCPVVLKLQNRIRNGFDEIQTIDGQIVIFGKEGHVEVNGLVGQTFEEAVIIGSDKDLEKIDYHRPVYLFSQTTKSPDDFQKLSFEIEKRLKLSNPDHPVVFSSHDTICRQVANRAPQLKLFASGYDAIIFVTDPQSSNGMFLFKICHSANANSHMITDSTEIEQSWFEHANRIGITGATSTPMWLMKEVEAKVLSLRN